MDTVIAVYDASGNRLGYNDDIAPGNHDSETSVALQAGHQYFLGVTNYISNTTHGSYNWSIDGPAHLAPVEQAIVDLTNQERQSAGLPTLAVNAQLVQAAQIHATNMARLDRLEHILPGTSLPTPEDRLSYVGYSYSSWGENIAYNYRDASAVVSRVDGLAGASGEHPEPQLHRDRRRCGPQQPRPALLLPGLRPAPVSARRQDRNKRGRLMRPILCSTS